jgi:hypothetical protein
MRRASAERSVGRVRDRDGGDRDRSAGRAQLRGADRARPCGRAVTIDEAAELPGGVLLVEFGNQLAAIAAAELAGRQI